MKIGIIGTNFVSEMMLEATSLLNEIEASVVCSRKIENAKAFADKHNIKDYVDDYKELLNFDLDAIYLAVPNVLHKDIAIFFLENKIPVFCEKPMASNYNEVKEIINTARANDTLLFEGLVPIYTEAFKQIKSSLANIGEVRRAVLAMNQYSSRYDAYRAGEVLNAFKPELSNGSVMDIGVYPLSVAIALFNKPKNVFASAHLLSSKVDGSGTIIMQYNGFDVVIMHSKISNQVMYSEIQGEDGTIVFDHVSIPKVVDLYLNKQEKTNVFTDDDKPAMYYEWEAFLNAFKHNKKEAYEGALNLSLDIHRTLTEIRKQTNVKFPADN